MSYDDNYQAKQRENLLKILNNHLHADVTFIIGKDEIQFEANRIFLSAISPVFDAMLYGNMQEGKQNANIQIPDIDQDAFKSVLNHAYGNDPKLSNSNIIEVAKICQKYEISLLSQLCDDYFKSLLTIDNFCEFLSASIANKLRSFISLCQTQITTTIGKSVKDVIKTDGFIKMSLEAMKTLLASHHLNIKEEKLWEAVLSWTEYQSKHNIDKYQDFDGQVPKAKKRKIDHNDNEDNDDDFKKDEKLSQTDEEIEGKFKIKLLKEIVHLIRFGLMDGKYFVDNIKPLNVLNDSEIAAISCFMHSENEKKCGIFSIMTRAYKPPEMKELRYSLSKQVLLALNCGSARLRSYDLSRVVVTKEVYSSPYIEINFDDVVRVKRIEIAAPKGYSLTIINGNTFEYTESGSSPFREVEKYGKLKIASNVIHQWSVDIRALYFRLRGPSHYGRVGVGCLRFYGWKEKEE